jgi:rubrerythrin
MKTKTKKTMLIIDLYEIEILDGHKIKTKVAEQDVTDHTIQEVIDLLAFEEKLGRTWEYRKEYQVVSGPSDMLMVCAWCGKTIKGESFCPACEKKVKHEMKKIKVRR